jgi:hypothetical protein
MLLLMDKIRHRRSYERKQEKRAQISGTNLKTIPRGNQPIVDGNRRKDSGKKSGQKSPLPCGEHDSDEKRNKGWRGTDIRLDERFDGKSKADRESG